MNEIMKFESAAVEFQKINGEWMAELYSVGTALGYVTKAKGKVYPYKERITKVVKNAEISPVSHGVKLFLTERMLYAFMLESHTDKCRAFRKWLTNEVLPALNHKGTYTMPNQGKQLRLGEKPYEYYDKTWNGVPVLTTEDFAQLTGLDRSFVSFHLRKSDFIEGADYYYLRGGALEQFKGAHPRLRKNVNHLYLITKSGFQKLCNYAGVKLNEPQCFIEQKEDSQDNFVCQNNKYKEELRKIREDAEQIKEMTYFLERCSGEMFSENEQLQLEKMLRKRVKNFASVELFHMSVYRVPNTR